jgi:hypothetical protein
MTSANINTSGIDLDQNGGDINIKVGQGGVNLNGSTISSVSLGTSGSLLVRSMGSINLSDSTLGTTPGHSNFGGSIFIKAPQFYADNRSRISLTAVGPTDQGFNNGSGGTITLSADDMTLDGASVAANSDNISGDIVVFARHFQLLQGGRIDASISGNGDGGTIRITADDVLIGGFRGSANKTADRSTISTERTSLINLNSRS